MATLFSLTHGKTDEIGWHERTAGCYSSEYANALEEPAGTEPHKMLAAIPSPLARLHVFEIAFAFLSDPKCDLNGDSTFHKVASQCLDALEILFHWRTHVESGYPLGVIRWDARGELELMREGSHEQHRLLADALGLYFDRDRAITTVKHDTWMLTANHGKPIVLAVSSPLTIVAPSPDSASAAKKLQLKPPGEERLYFSGAKSLQVRPAAFRAYIEHLFGSRNLQVNCPELFRYLRRVQKTTQDFKELQAFAAAQYTEVVVDGSPITVHGEHIVCGKAAPVPANVLASPRRMRPDRDGMPFPPIVLVDGTDSLGATRAGFRAPVADPSPIAERALPDIHAPYPYVVEADFFEECIIKLPYGLDASAFVLPAECAKPEAAFLPPIRREYFQFFDASHLAQRLRIEPVQGQGVRCELEIPLQERSVKLTHTYFPNPQTPGKGRIIEHSLGIAAFPAVAWDRTETERGENCIDQQVVTLVELNEPNDVRWRSELAFLHLANGALQPPPAGTVVLKERSPKTQGDFATRHYLLNNWRPDVIEVSVDAGDGKMARSVLCPAARPRRSENREFIVAVDFGTTNTHVSIAEKQRGNAPPVIQPLMPRSDRGEPCIMTLHNRGSNAYFAKAIEQALFHESVPVQIGDQPWFPTRTALAERTVGIVEELGADANIAFFMYKEDLRESDYIETHLKWARKNDREIVKRIRLLLRELLVLVRSHILLKGGDPAKTTLLWFWPLSFTEYLRATLEKLWQEEAARILDIKDDAILSITESAAPYYYHEAHAQAVSVRPVLSIDVGGGSTDVVFFVSKTPKFGSSFNFASNALWGDGFDIAGTGVQRNGVASLALALREKALAQAQGDTARRSLLNDMWGGFHRPGLRSSHEIVNFAFASDKYTGFTDELKNNSTVKLMVLLHYSAIVFHCARIMREKDLERAGLVSLSGNGTKALAFLGSLDYVADHTAAVFRIVYEHWQDVERIPLSTPAEAVAALGPIVKRGGALGGISLLVADRLKEATTEGGIHWHTVRGGVRSEPEAYVLLGGPNSLHRHRDVPRYNELGSAHIAAADDEFRRFLAVFQALSGSYDRFGLSDGFVEHAMPVLWRDVADTIQTGLERRQLNAEGAAERAGETLFFYPLVHKLWQISHDLRA